MTFSAPRPPSHPKSSRGNPAAPVQPIFLAIFLAIFATLMSGCASKTSVSSNWEANGRNQAPFSRVLVVAMSKDAYRQQRFENEMVESLRGQSNQVWAISSLMTINDSLDNDLIEKLAKEKNADAIIVTHVGSSNVTAKEISERVDYKVVRKTGAPFDFFRYDYNEFDEPAYTVANMTITLVTEVYETQSGQVVYIASSRAEKQEAIYTAIDLLSDLVAKRLKSDGVTR
jgi:hypothetical protein